MCKVCQLKEVKAMGGANVEEKKHWINGDVQSLMSHTSSLPSLPASSECSGDRLGTPVPTPTVFREVLDAELSLWTFAMTALFAYLFAYKQQPRRFGGPLFGLLVVAPAVVALTLLLSSALLVAIAAGRLFFGKSSVDAVDYAEWISPASALVGIGQKQNRRSRRDSVVSNASSSSLSSGGSAHTAGVNSPQVGRKDGGNHWATAPRFFEHRRQSLDRRFTTMYRRQHKISP